MRVNLRGSLGMKGLQVCRLSLGNDRQLDQGAPYEPSVSGTKTCNELGPAGKLTMWFRIPVSEVRMCQDATLNR